jgi:hypothetical protein
MQNSLFPHNHNHQHQQQQQQHSTMSVSAPAAAVSCIFCRIIKGLSLSEGYISDAFLGAGGAGVFLKKKE